jgi:hypothetical protein
VWGAAKLKLLREPLFQLVEREVRVLYTHKTVKARNKTVKARNKTVKTK